MMKKYIDVLVKYFMKQNDLNESDENKIKLNP